MVSVGYHEAHGGACLRTLHERRAAFVSAVVPPPTVPLVFMARILHRCRRPVLASITLVAFGLMAVGGTSLHAVLHGGAAACRSPHGAACAEQSGHVHGTHDEGYACTSKSGKAKPAVHHRFASMSRGGSSLPGEHARHICSVCWMLQTGLAHLATPAVVVGAPTPSRRWLRAEPISRPDSAASLPPPARAPPQLG